MADQGTMVEAATVITVLHRLTPRRDITPQVPTIRAATVVPELDTTGTSPLLPAPRHRITALEPMGTVRIMAPVLECASSNSPLVRAARISIVPRCLPLPPTMEADIHALPPSRLR